MSKTYKKFVDKLKAARDAGSIGPLARAALRRPDDYDELPESRQWDIDKTLGILDWDGSVDK